jgi:hypothetical protein
MGRAGRERVEVEFPIARSVGALEHTYGRLGKLVLEKSPPHSSGDQTSSSRAARA